MHGLSRLIVHDKIHDAFVEKMIVATRALKVGHALEAGTQLSPVASEAQLKAIFHGSTLQPKKAASVSPGVSGSNSLRQVTTWRRRCSSARAMTCASIAKNSFAPMACVIKTGSYEEALAQVNDTRFGLTVGIMTGSLSRATHFRHQRACRLRDGQSADRWHRLPRALRRSRRFQLRPARAGKMATRSSSTPM